MRKTVMAVGVCVAGMLCSGGAAFGQYEEAWDAKIHSGAEDVGVDVAADPSKFSFVAGWVQISATKTSIKVRAYDTDGNIKDSVIWGPYNGHQKPHAMTIVPTYENIGGVSLHVKTYVYVTGEGPRSNLADQDMVTLQWVFDVPTATFDNGGTPTVKKYHNVGDDIGWDIAVVGTSVVATGSSAGSGTLLDTVTIAYVALSNLAEVWSQPDRYNYNNHDDVAVSVSRGPPNANNVNESTVVIAGYSNNGSNDDMLVRQLKASDGSHLQTWRRNTGGDERGTAVTSDNVSAIFVTGWTTLSLGTGGSPDSFSYGNYMTTRYEQGNLFPIWSDIYQGAAGLVDIAYSIAYSDYFDGNNAEHRVVYVGGAASENVNNGLDFRVLKYEASDGDLGDWDPANNPLRGLFDGSDHLDDECFDIGVDNQGNPYATGHSIQTHNSVNAFDFATMRFGAAAGDKGDSNKFNPLFFDGSSHGDDSANAIDVWQYQQVNEVNPDVWVGGERTDTSQGLNIGIVKYIYVP